MNAKVRNGNDDPYRKCEPNEEKKNTNSHCPI